MKKISDYYDEAYQCIRCGACQAHCPIFSVTGREFYVARGKVRLIREMLDHNLEMTSKLRHYMDMCLGCRSCVVNCPAKVETDSLIMAVRNHYVNEQGLPLIYHIALKHIMANKSIFELGIKSMGLLRGLKLNNLLPKDLKKREEILPDIPKRTFKQQMSDIEFKKNMPRRVGFFLSCMDNLMFPEGAKACIKVLQAHDWEVVIPTNTVCCGGPHYAYGAWDTARELAEKNIKAFQEADVSAIVTDCATCGSVLKDYAKFFDEGSEMYHLARELFQKVYDINYFLVHHVDVKTGPNSYPALVTYHDPCHLVRYQGITAEPREVLKRVNGVQFKEAEEADMCCGSAGTFNMNHYEESMKILDRKIKNLQKTEAGVFVTACPACRIQLSHGCRMEGLDIPVMYPVEVLAKTY